MNPSGFAAKLGNAGHKSALKVCGFSAVFTSRTKNRTLSAVF